MTRGLADLIPDVDTLLQLPPERVGLQLLQLAAAGLQNGIFYKDGIAGPNSLFEENYLRGRVYTSSRRDETILAVGEAWHWLELNMLIMPAPSPNNTYSRLTRKGREIASNPSRFATFAAAADFPRTLLHPRIADEVWLQLSQGAYDVAVFVAFKEVEIAVREASGFAVDEHGVPMMRRAFNKDTGPLRRATDPEAEREALSALFAGAVGSYKNPHSHRSVGLNDAGEVQEMLVLASHLLRIVEDRSV